MISITTEKKIKRNKNKILRFSAFAIINGINFSMDLNDPNDHNDYNEPSDPKNPSDPHSSAL